MTESQTTGRYAERGATEKKDSEKILPINSLAQSCTQSINSLLNIKRSGNENVGASLNRTQLNQVSMKKQKKSTAQWQSEQHAVFSVNLALHNQKRAEQKGQISKMKVQRIIKTNRMIMWKLIKKANLKRLPRKKRSKLPNGASFVPPLYECISRQGAL